MFRLERKRPGSRRSRLNPFTAAALRRFPTMRGGEYGGERGGLNSLSDARSFGNWDDLAGRGSLPSPAPLLTDRRASGRILSDYGIPNRRNAGGERHKRAPPNSRERQVRESMNRALPAEARGYRSSPSRPLSFPLVARQRTEMYSALTLNKRRS